MRQYRKVAGMVLAVLTPFAALTAFALIELGTNARHDIERTIDAKVDGCMAAVEREAARHIAALQTLSATMDGDLPALRRRADAVLLRMKPDWLTVVLASGELQVFNLRLPEGSLLPRTIDPVANERSRAEDRAILGGVVVDKARLSEPFITVRTSVNTMAGQRTPYVLLAAVRAWAFSETIRQCGLPAPEWRIGLVDADMHIVARTVSEGPLDPYIGQLSSETFRQGLASGQPFFDSQAIDGLQTFTGIARSERHGWTASVSVPVEQVDEVVWQVWVFAGSISLVGLLAAAVTCFLMLRMYARTATTDRLEASLIEKDTLLREIHHRVKNNLQSIWGMMQFERSRISDVHAKGRIEVIMDRILVLGSIHQQLYESASLSRINLASHLGELVARVGASLEPDRIAFQLDVEPLCCDLETALPLGLITSELIGNAQKHAFPNGRTGTVRVQLRQHADDGNVRLGVFDDGVGKQNDHPVGIGMVLVELLASQCGASVDVSYPGGCHACVTVPGDLFFEATPR
jgi:two-component sensor histidine kinase